MRLVGLEACGTQAILFSDAWLKITGKMFGGSLSLFLLLN